MGNVGFSHDSYRETYRRRWNFFKQGKPLFMLLLSKAQMPHGSGDICNLLFTEGHLDLFRNSMQSIVEYDGNQGILVLLHVLRLSYG